MLHTFYLRKSIVYIPSLGKIETGGWREIDPVAVVPVSNSAGIKRAFQDVIARGNPVVPGLAHAEYPDPVLPKYAGVKSYNAFVRGAFAWSTKERDGVYQIIGKRKMNPRGWENDPAQTITLPPGSTVDALCDRLIEILQAKAAQA